MRRWGPPPEPGAPPGGAIPEARRERHAQLLGRSAAAALTLAFTTVAGVVGAVLALLPAAVRRHPAGRLGPRGAGELAEPAEPPAVR